MNVKTFPIADCPSWSYRTLTHTGTCKVDGQQIRMRFTVTLTDPCEVPDVLEIEKLAKSLPLKPDTLEGYTHKLAVWLGLPVTGVGRTATHGFITVTMNPDDTLPLL